MHHKFSIIALLSVLMLASCNDLFEDAPNDKLSENLIWTNPQLLDEYVMPLYDGMDDGFSTFVTTISLVKGMGREYEPWYADQLTVSRSDWYTADYGNVLKSSQQDITQKARVQWLAYYSAIRTVNNLLEHMPDIPEGAQKERLKGEAHFFRAYYYYCLLRNFGGPLLVKRTFDPLHEDSTSVRFPRASFEETVRFIVEEAEAAAPLLAVTNSTEDTGRATRGAAYTLAGKAYMWAAGVHFQNVAAETPWLGFPDNRTKEMLLAAEKEYNKVSDLKVYSLVPIQGTTQDEIVAGYRKIFLTKNSQESIWEVQVADDGDYSTKNGHQLDRMAAAPYFGGTYCAYVPTQNHVDEYCMAANGLPITNAASGYDKNKPYEGRDPRFYANVLYDGATWNGHVMDIHYTIDEDGKEVPGADLTKYGTSETAAVTKTGYYMAKFLNEKQKIDYDDTYASSQNCILWRWAEIMLDYAEIYYQTDRPGDALDMLNQIRGRVHMPPYSSITWDNIMNERRVEMAFEKTTYWDLLRYGTAEQKMTGKSNPLYGVKIVLKQDGTYTRTQKTVNGKNTTTRYFRARQYFKPMSWDDVRFHGVEQNPEWLEM